MAKGWNVYKMSILGLCDATLTRAFLIGRPAFSVFQTLEGLTVAKDDAENIQITTSIVYPYGAPPMHISRSGIRVSVVKIHLKTRHIKLGMYLVAESDLCFLGSCGKPPATKRFACHAHGPSFFSEAAYSVQRATSYFIISFRHLWGRIIQCEMVRAVSATRRLVTYRAEMGCQWYAYPRKH
jgi:hypothetical protein